MVRLREQLSEQQPPFAVTVQVNGGPSHGCGHTDYLNKPINYNPDHTTAGLSEQTHIDESALSNLVTDLALRSQ